MVLGIRPHLRGGEFAVELIGAAEDDGADEFFDRPFFSNKSLREVVEQLGMRRATAIHAKVIRRGNDAAAKEMQPHAVGHHARGERVLRMRQPLSQFPPTALLGVDRHGVGHLRGSEESTRDGFAQLVGFAVAIDFGIANLLRVAHPHGEILRRRRRTVALGREHLAAALGPAGDGVQLLRLAGAKRAREEGKLRQVASEGHVKKIVPTADENVLRATGGNRHFAVDFRLGIAVEIQPRAFAVAHEHEVIPRARRDDRTAGQRHGALVAVEEEEFTRMRVALVIAADADLVTGRTARPEWAARKHVARHRARVVLEIIAEPK